MTDKPRFGATANDWLTLDMWCGLGRDLLPVVSNPKAIISADSKMKDKGKVPSKYNRAHEVIGIGEWTKYNAKPEDITRWSANPDYGICIQTRNVRALDVDVPDPMLAEEIALFIVKQLDGLLLPTRIRGNSAKFLYAFRVEGDMPKRVIKVREKVKNEDGTTKEPAWIIEFLANGQQFVAAGTHSSGARIEWVNCDGMPDDFPELTVAEFEKLWAALEAKFACEPSAIGSIRKRGESFESTDETAVALADKGLILGEGNDGQFFIECPWKGDHSMDSGITETAYFPRGTGGYELGHFKCLHAGCASYSDTDFEERLGLRDDMFEALSAVVETDETGRVVQPLPKFSRNKAGQIDNTLKNLALALARPDVCGRHVRYDIFRDEDTVALPGQVRRPMEDSDMVKLRDHLERGGFKTIGKDLIRDAICAHGADDRYDSAIEWAETLPAWDGKPRVDGFLRDYFGAEDTPYAAAVSRYIWTALAGRCLVPGIKADMVPVLYGAQGAIKSTAIAALVPWEELFVELSLGDDDKELMRLMKGTLVAELGELRGLHTKEMESIKAFIARRFDKWTPKFKERPITIWRRTLFIGTTNHPEFLTDETGNRRFLPIAVIKGDIKRIERDRLQLWAEGIALFRKSGIAYHKAEELARDEHEKFMVHDSWQENIQSWLDTTDMTGTTPGSREFVRTSEVLFEALNIDSRSANMATEKRVGKVLKSMGYNKLQRKVDGRNLKVWVKS